MSKKRRFQKPGLWFSQTRAEIEVVTPRMKKVCDSCDVHPRLVRLKLTHGSGRHATTTILCTSCGTEWIEGFKVLAQRAKKYLLGMPGISSVRIP